MLTYIIIIKGTAIDVAFRKFIKTTAVEFGIRGYIENKDNQILIKAQTNSQYDNPKVMNLFLDLVKNYKFANIESYEYYRENTNTIYSDFEIIAEAKMDREIKFRGVADRQGGGIEFVYGSLIADQNQDCAYYSTRPDRISWVENGAYCSKPIREGSAMQFTGLIDKNGVEIYEGDVVGRDEYYCEYDGLSDNYTPQHFVVNYMNCAWWGRKTTGFRMLLWDLCHIESGEIKGNIFDNPELLEA